MHIFGRRELGIWLWKKKSKVIIVEHKWNKENYIILPLVILSNLNKNWKKSSVSIDSVHSPQILSSVYSKTHPFPSFWYCFSQSYHWPPHCQIQYSLFFSLNLSSPFSAVDCCLFLKILSSLGSHDTMLSWLSSVQSPLLTLLMDF